MAALAVCGLLTFGAGTASAAEPPDIAQLVAAMQQEGQNAAEKAAFTGGGYRASLARAAETAAQAAAAAPVSAPAQEDPGETGGDEEPSEPAPVTQHSIHDENGYYVHNGSAYNSITKDGLWVGGTDENTGFHVDSDGSVYVDNTKYISSEGLSGGGNKITGVAAGEISQDSTDAVNGSQLYNAIQVAEGTTYAAGDGVAITDGSTTGEDKTISVKAGNGIEAGADGVAVKVNGNNLTVNENGVSLSETLSGLTSVETGTLTASGAVTAGSFSTTGSITGGSVTADGVTIDGGKITGLVTESITGDTDATNKKYVDDKVTTAIGELDIPEYSAGNGIDITGETISAKAKENGNIVVDENGISLAADVKDLTSVTASGAVTAGSFSTTGSITGGSVTADGVTVDNGKITGLVTESITGDTDATNKKYVDDKVTTAIGELDIPEYSAGNGIDITGETISAKAKENGNIVVDENGISLAADVKDLTSVTASGAVTAGSFSTTGSITGGSVKVGDVTINGGKITGLDTDSIQNAEDAVNKAYVDNLAFNSGKTYTAGNGIAISEAGEISAKAKENGNIVVDGDGISLAKEVTGLTSVTATGAITAGSFSGTSASIGGIGISSGKITGLTTASITENTDAANKEYVDKAVADIDVPEYKAGNGIAITGDTISAKAKQDGNIVVDENGISLTTEVNGLTSVATGTLTATGAITGGSVTVDGVTIDGGKITGLVTDSITGDTDAANKKYVDDKVTTAIDDLDIPEYTAGNGIEINEGKISAKAKQDGNIVVDENGISLAADVKGLTSLETGILTASGAVTAGSFNAGNIKINASDSAGTITGLTNTEWTGTATNGRAATEDQLASVQSKIKDYTAGDGISIDDDSDEISVKYGNGLDVDNGSLTVKGYDGITVDENGVSVNLASNSGLGFDRGALYIMTPRGGNIEITEDGLDLADEVSGLTSLSAGTLTATNSLTAGSIIVDGKTYISSSGLNANGVITGVSAGTISASSTEAVNGSQLFEIKQVSDLAVTYTSAAKDRVELGKDGNNATLTHVADGALSGTSTDAVNGKQLYVVDEKVGDAEWKTSHWLAEEKDLTSAVSILDSKIGNLEMGQLDYLKGTQTSVTSALYGLNEAIGPVKFTAGNYITDGDNLTTAAQKLDLASSAIANAIGVQKNEEGGLSTTINWSSDLRYVHSGDTIATGVSNLDRAMQDLDDRVLTLEGKNPAGQSLAAFSKMSTANVSALSALSNMDTKTAETLASMSSEQVETLAAKAPAAAPAAPAPGDPTATSTRPGPDGESETGDTGDAYEVKQDLHVTGDTTLDGTLTVDGAGTFNDGLTVNTKTEGGTALTVNGGASINGTLNMNGNKITGVADGEISETSTDAVNGSQLWGVQQDIENNASAIASLGGQVSRLDNRIDRVGAGAAALAALHPLDYDPEVKWDFAAGYGNYRSANAVAVGAYYRPNEDVMFSIGGSMGGGENMMNAGVSFKLGSGSGLTTSRTAMARELAAMKDTVAAQNAQIEAQAKQIEELTALVAQLAAEKAGAPEEKKA